METIIIAAAILLSIFVIINLCLTYKLFTRSSESYINELKNEISNFEKNLVRIETTVKDEFSRNREESSKLFKDFRIELGESFKNFENSILNRINENTTFQKNQFETFSGQLNLLTKSNEEKIEKMSLTIQERLTAFNSQITSNSKDTRDELSKSLQSFENKISSNIKNFNDLQKEKFEQFTSNQNELIKTNEQKLEQIRGLVEEKLQLIQNDTNTKLDVIKESNQQNHTAMNNTIQEKLSSFQEQINSNAKINRDELNKSLKDFKDSFTVNVKDFNDLQKQNFDSLILKQDELIRNNEQKLENMRTMTEQKLKTIQEDNNNKLDKIKETNQKNHETINNTIQEKLNYFQEQINSNAKINRDELTKSLKDSKDSFTVNVREFNELQKQKFDSLILKQDGLVKTTEEKLDKMRETVEQKLKSIQDDSTNKLEKIRETVDEKLHKTLEQRLGDSFKIVSERLELVHKGLGEMQNLATGVGDLKKVLSNVKTKGVLGEYQLENILEELMTNEQYFKNIKTKKGSNDMVEFAVKMPGMNDNSVWLPIDSKFPTETYEALMEAYNNGDSELIESNQKNLAAKIKLCAKDISDKYIDPPNTTDFGIMFLPFEGLYAEVLRINGLFESLQRDYKIIITGPTTLSALLNSLQIGFKTLAIEKRTSEVWELLGAVKTEFGRFGTVLEKTQKKLQEASKVIDEAGVRTRAIERKLKNVEELPIDDTNHILGNSNLLAYDEVEAINDRQ